MNTLELPQLTGTRSRARAMIEDAGLPDDLSGADVHLDGHLTLAGTGSFADEVVRILLVERLADRVVVINVGPDLHAKLARAAAEHGVAEKVSFE